MDPWLHVHPTTKGGWVWGRINIQVDDLSKAFISEKASLHLVHGDGYHVWKRLSHRVVAGQVQWKDEFLAPHGICVGPNLG